MSKHTPGPWRVSPTGEILGSNNWVVAQVDGYGGKTVQNNANRNLIAAATELLEALKNCRAELLRLSPTASKAAIADADLAIAKATGGAE